MNVYLWLTANLTTDSSDMFSSFIFIDSTSIKWQNFTYNDLNMKLTNPTTTIITCSEYMLEYSMVTSL